MLYSVFLTDFVNTPHSKWPINLQNHCCGSTQDQCSNKGLSIWRAVTDNINLWDRALSSWHSRIVQFYHGNHTVSRVLWLKKLGLKQKAITVTINRLSCRRFYCLTPDMKFNCWWHVYIHVHIRVQTHTRDGACCMNLHSKMLITDGAAISWTGVGIGVTMAGHRDSSVWK